MSYHMSDDLKREHARIKQLGQDLYKEIEMARFSVTSAQNSQLEQLKAIGRDDDLSMFTRGLLLTLAANWLTDNHDETVRSINAIWYTALQHLKQVGYITYDADDMNGTMELHLTPVKPVKYRLEFHIFDDADRSSPSQISSISHYADIDWARTRAHERIGAILDALYPGNEHEITELGTVVTGRVITDKGGAKRVVMCVIKQAG